MSCRGAPEPPGQPSLVAGSYHCPEVKNFSETGLCAPHPHLLPRRLQLSSPREPEQIAKEQDRWMRWNWQEYDGCWEACWRPSGGPTAAHAKQLVDFYLDEGLIVGIPRNYKLSFLARGAFNEVFKLEFSADTSNGLESKVDENKTSTSHTPEQGSMILPSCMVLRLGMPVDPYFKVESEVATTNFVRDIGVPSPRIFLFDSSAANPLSLEPIFMEYISGMPVDEWEEANYSRADHGTLIVPSLRQVQSYVEKLQDVSFDRIGSVYYDWEGDGGYIIGPIVDFHFFPVAPSHSKLNRGPFPDTLSYMSAILDVWSIYIQDEEPSPQLLHGLDSPQESEWNFDTDKCDVYKVDDKDHVMAEIDSDTSATYSVTNIAYMSGIKSDDSVVCLNPPPSMQSACPTSPPSSPPSPTLLATIPQEPLRTEKGNLSLTGRVDNENLYRAAGLTTSIRQRVNLARRLFVLLAQQFPWIFPPSSDNDTTPDTRGASNGGRYLKPHIFHSDMHGGNIIFCTTTGIIQAILDWEQTLLLPGPCRMCIPRIMSHTATCSDVVMASTPAGELAWVPNMLGQMEDFSLVELLVEIKRETASTWYSTVKAAEDMAWRNGHLLASEFGPPDEAVCPRSVVLGGVVSLLEDLAGWNEHCEFIVKEAVEVLEQWGADNMPDMPVPVGPAGVED